MRRRAGRRGRSRLPRTGRGPRQRPDGHRERGRVRPRSPASSSASAPTRPQRIVSLVLLGRHRADGAGRPDRRSSSTASSRPAPSASTPSARRTPSTAASTGTPRSRSLQENTAYSYRVGAEGGWSPTYAFKTQDFEGDYDFLFFGDPQIGSSGDVPKDQAGWEDTLNVALAANPNAELLVSGGDQVETANTEAQWTAFLAPDKLRQYPWAATIGNHDVGGKAYEQHFCTPNTDRSAAYYNGNPTTQSGGDYWYIYKDVLFIDLNSNATPPADGCRRRRGARRLRHRRRQQARRRGQVQGARLPPLDLLAGRPRERHRQQAAPRGLPDGVLQPRRRPGPAGPRPQLLAQLRDQERPEGRTRPSSPAPPTCSRARAASSTSRRTPPPARSTTTSRSRTPAAPASGQRPGPAEPEQATGTTRCENQEHVRSYVKVAGARRQARRREHPQRHLRGAERGGRGRASSVRPTAPRAASRSARSSTR